MTKKERERIIVELYNTGKTSYEIGKILGLAQRTIEKYEQRLRIDKKIEYREYAPVTKTVSKLSANLEEIKSLNWVIPKSTKKLNSKKKPFTSYLVIADTHIPHINVIAMKSIFKLMDDISFDGFINLGDFMDMSPISHWLQNKRKTLENKRMLLDYQEGNKLLDELDKRLPKGCDKHFFYGNHEDWYFQLIETYPALEGLLEPKIELKLEERGYKVYTELNHIERIGRLNFTHGIYHNVHYVKKHIDELKSNILFGHLHSPRVRFESSPAREIAIAGYCVGCLCDMSPVYMKNRPDKWSHGFAVIYFYENGYFDVDLKRIVKGKFVFNNHLYDGNR